MSLLERAIEAVSPGWAMRREAQRQGLAVLRSGYASAGTGRLQEGWTPTSASPNAVLEAGLPMTLRRSRDLVRNNPWASIALRRLTAAIVGTQVTAAVPLEGARARKAVADDWRELVETGNDLSDATWDADLAVMTRTIVECGFCIVVWAYTPSAEGRRVPLTWRALPPEYLDTARMQPAGAGNFVSHGVEIDPQGRVVGYWLFERHPLETVFGRAVSSRFAPVEMVDLVREQLWIGQRIGLPWLSPSAVAMDDLQQYETAALWKARMAAAFGIVKTEAGTGTSQLSASRPVTRRDGTTEEQIGPGMILRNKPGEAVSQLTPPRDDNFRVFWDTRLFAMAAGIGVPVHLLSGDLSQANYSSLREGKLQFWELVDSWQWNMIHDQLLRRAWRRFGRARFAAGRTVGGILPPVKWSFPKRPWVDPAKDLAALTDELDLGLTTWPDAIGARGEDAEEQLATIELWNGRLAQAGMPVGRGRLGGPGVAAPATAPAETVTQSDTTP